MFGSFCIGNRILHLAHVKKPAWRTWIFATSSSSSRKPTLTLYTKEECELCDKALESIAHLQDRFNLQAVDITLPENEHWFGLYRYEIPVFYLNGKFFSKNKIEPEKLEQALRQLDC